VWWRRGEAGGRAEPSRHRVLTLDEAASANEATDSTHSQRRRYTRRLGTQESKGVFVRVAAAGLASLTGPGLVRPGHGRPPSGVCLPALGEPG
jgi:hypothetical protein